MSTRSNVHSTGQSRITWSQTTSITCRRLQVPNYSHGPTADARAPGARKGTAHSAQRTAHRGRRAAPPSAVTLSVAPLRQRKGEKPAPPRAPAPTTHQRRPPIAHWKQPPQGIRLEAYREPWGTCGYLALAALSAGRQRCKSSTSTQGEKRGAHHTGTHSLTLTHTRDANSTPP